MTLRERIDKAKAEPWGRKSFMVRIEEVEELIVALQVAKAHVWHHCKDPDCSYPVAYADGVGGDR